MGDVTAFSAAAPSSIIVLLSGESRGKDHKTKSSSGTEARAAIIQNAVKSRAELYKVREALWRGTQYLLAEEACIDLLETEMANCVTDISPGLWVLCHDI